MRAIQTLRGGSSLYGEKSRVLYNLDMGLLYHYAGMPDSSTHYLAAAEQEIQELYTKSVSLAVISFLTNDTESRGIEDLAAAIESYADFQKQADSGRERRKAVARWRLLELLQERLLSDLLDQNGTRGQLDLRGEPLFHQLADILVEVLSWLSKVLAESLNGEA